MAKHHLVGLIVAAVAVAFAVWYNTAGGAYNSVITQSFHYFARPHEGVLREPLKDVRAAWIGSQLQQNKSEWLTILSPDEVQELVNAATAATNTGKPVAELGKQDCPLPTLTRLVDAVRQELSGVNGLGFHVIRGVPVEQLSQAQAEALFWCFGQHLGIPGAQNNDGDLLGHVRDVGGNPETDRRYKTHAFLEAHCDAADVVGLLCLQSAKRGGTSRLVSSVTVYNRLLEAQPDVIERLYQPFLLDTRGTGGVNYVPIRPVRYSGGELRTFYHTKYFRTSYRHKDAPAGGMPEADEAVMAAYDALAVDEELVLDMDFLPGDMQLLSNHVILHSRSEYEDHPPGPDGQDRRRHLLRLWLSLDGPRAWSERLSKGAAQVGLGWEFVWGKVRKVVWGW